MSTEGLIYGCGLRRATITSADRAALATRSGSLRRRRQHSADPGAAPGPDFAQSTRHGKTMARHSNDRGGGTRLALLFGALLACASLPVPLGLAAPDEGSAPLKIANPHFDALTVADFEFGTTQHSGALIPDGSFTLGCGGKVDLRDARSGNPIAGAAASVSGWALTGTGGVIRSSESFPAARRKVRQGFCSWRATRPKRRCASAGRHAAAAPNPVYAQRARFRPRQPQRGAARRGGVSAPRVAAAAGRNHAAQEHVRAVGERRRPALVARVRLARRESAAGRFDDRAGRGRLCHRRSRQRPGGFRRRESFGRPAENDPRRRPAGAGLLRVADSAGAGAALFEVPLRRQAEGRACARPSQRLAAGRRLGAGACARQARRKRAAGRAAVRKLRDAPHRPPAGQRRAGLCHLDRARGGRSAHVAPAGHEADRRRLGGRLPRASRLVEPATPGQAGRARGRPSRVAARRGRSFHPRGARGPATGAGRPGRSPHACPAAQLCARRFAANGRGARAPGCRSVAERL